MCHPPRLSASHMDWFISARISISLAVFSLANFGGQARPIGTLCWNAVALFKSETSLTKFPSSPKCNIL
ncbi:hypothetical protein K449DRAFT_383342 [Hypoxylon sp. EC38]|nr:hypothetical protein K449DRAFT_383342 [Hypoxylon sp. EC38]